MHLSTESCVLICTFGKMYKSDYNEEKRQIFKAEFGIGRFGIFEYSFVAFFPFFSFKMFALFILLPWHELAM